MIVQMKELEFFGKKKTQRQNIFFTTYTYTMNNCQNYKIK